MKIAEVPVRTRRNGLKMNTKKHCPPPSLVPAEHGQHHGQQRAPWQRCNSTLFTKLVTASLEKRKMQDSQDATNSVAATLRNATPACSNP